MIITIQDKKIEIKNKMRAYLIYEQIADKAFNPKTLTEMMLYFYSLILANCPSVQLTFSEFMDYLDDNSDVLIQFNNWMIEEGKKNSQFTDDLKKSLNQL